jgi:ribosomal protein S21
MIEIRNREIYESPSETVRPKKKYFKYLIKWRDYGSEFLE